MKTIRTEDAAGHVLCHDLTRIVRGSFKGAQFKKGHIITADDIPMLLSMGKEHLYVYELGQGMLHENDAAERLCRIAQGANTLRKGEISEGKIELVAACDGLFCVDTARLDRINGIDGIILATRKGNTAVRRGDKLCGMRVVPLVIEAEKLNAADAAAGEAPLVSVLPYTVRSAGLIVTGSEVLSGRIADTFSPVVTEKLAAYGVTVTQRVETGDDPDCIGRTIAELWASGAPLILCTGGMSVDPDDNTPGAIKKSGANIITYGAPVLPGAMFLLGYYDDGVPILGLPGCVMYAKATVFDLVLPRILAGVRLSKHDFSRMGEGGLCLGCDPCRYPLCPFGK